MPFAFRTYHDYALGRSGSLGSLGKHNSSMKKFKRTFCRKHVHTHFLGLFDTVNSVPAHEAPFRKEISLPVPAPEAAYIRHAVSIDERRLKFRPVLFSHNDGAATQNGSATQDIKEVWFAGNHGDVGGGWAPGEGTDVQLSDIALEWMLSEVGQLPDPLAFNNLRADFLNTMEEKRADAIKCGVAHDALSFSKGLGWAWALFWWIFGSPSYLLPSPFFFTLPPFPPFPLSSTPPPTPHPPGLSPLSPHGRAC